MSGLYRIATIFISFDLVVEGVEQTDVSRLSAGYVISSSWPGLPVNEHSRSVHDRNGFDGVRAAVRHPYDGVAIVRSQRRRADVWTAAWSISSRCSGSYGFCTHAKACRCIPSPGWAA